MHNKIRNIHKNKPIVLLSYLFAFLVANTIVFLYTTCFGCTQTTEQTVTKHILTKLLQQTSSTTEPDLCEWVFVEYISSKWEQYWIDNIQQFEQSPCQQFHNNDNSDNSATWVSTAGWSQTLKPSSTPDTAVFSTFKYERKCDLKQFEMYIEPLALLTRHPFYCFDEIYQVNKEYLYIDWQLNQKLADSSSKRQVFYFDLGASFWNSGLGGASQAWFVQMLEDRGLTLTGIYAWEYTPYYPELVWGDIPAKYWPIYHWYNVGASAEENSHKNPLNILKMVAKPGDYVLLKIDIDTPSIENPLMEQILRDPEIYSLIDDLFFEHHVYVDEMATTWTEMNGTLSDSYKLFSDLRKKGVRAHSWV